MLLKQRTSFIIHFVLTLVWLWLGGMFHVLPVRAAPITDLPVTVTQPDGTLLNLFASGDEYYNWLHDLDGYTIIQDPITGYYVYADLVDEKLVPTRFVVGKINPASEGLRPFINISPEQIEEIRQTFLDQTKKMERESGSAPQTAGASANDLRTGTLTNLVVFIRFSEEAEFTDTTSKYTDMLNGSTSGMNSLHNYFQEASYNAFTIDSFLFPTPGTTIVSYQDSHPRAYYQPYNAVTNPIGYTASERAQREHTLLKEAILYVNGLGQFPSGLNIDADGDGRVDSLTFIVRGSPGGWSELLWPHAWSLSSYTVTINGKRAYRYQFQLQTYVNTGVLAHESFHILGAPDLYHYTSAGTPVGSWDVMANPKDPPQHMSCYMKYKYGGWINSIPELAFTTPATYSLDSLIAPANNCKKIISPYSTTEFFVVEYRNKGGGSLFESSLPGSGLLVYRINTLVRGDVNGPPDEVYVYRSNDVVNDANFSSAVGRTFINDSTHPSSALSNGDPGGLNLCNIGAAGMTISFDVCLAPGYTISGNAGVPGAALSYMDGTLKTIPTKGDGSYSLVVSAGWSGSVTVSKPGFTFSPSGRSYTDVFFNRMGQDYTASGPANLLQDSGFEAFVPGNPHPNWTALSTNFGTPLCTTASCGITSTTGPQTGSAWGRFGATIGNETASLSQTVTIPSGMAFLDFYLWIGYAQPGSDAADVFTATIDGVPVFSANATQYAAYPTYKFVSVDVSAFADNAPHTITFSAMTTDQEVDFNLDDVALFSVPAVTSIVRANPDPTSAVSVDFTVTFSGAVTDVDADDFTLNVTSGIAGANITNVTGSGSTRTVTVNTGSGSGTLRLDIPASATIVDLAGYSLGNLPFTNGQAYTIAKIPIAATLNSPVGSIGTNAPVYRWNQVSDATWYYLWVDGPTGAGVVKQWYTRAQANCNGSTCSVTPTTSLSAGVYKWYVQTCNDVGYGPWSAGVSFSLALPGSATLTSPGGDISTNTPTYMWNQVSDATWYYLWIDGPSGNVFKQWYTSLQANCNGSTCSVTPAKTLSTSAHVWAVQTWNDAGYGPWSTSMSFNIPASALPGKATLTSPTGTISTNTTTYQWNEVSGATWYYLWIDGPSGNVFKQWYTSAQVNCNGSICSVTPARTLSAGAHVWAVQTYNDAGYGPWSTSMSFTVAVPGKATLTSPSGSISSYTPTYQWNEVSGATWYYLWVDGPLGNVIKIWYTRAQADCNGSTCSVTPSTILGSGAHVWAVQTWNEIGYGPWSTSVSFSVP